MTNKEKRIFFDWLQKHGILKQYKQNRYAFSERYHVQDSSYALLSFLYAIDAFVWRETPEGYDFWDGFDYAWSLFARNLYDT